MATPRTTNKETITFRIPSKKRAELDRIALRNTRDRSFILNEAIDAYLEIQTWQEKHIEQGLADAKKGDFATTKEIEALFGK
jgi:predicted transcriptional regulator